ncbi:uncharacterized protein LOC131323638 [Rhododendron vialii]|uniref:uncharacterized protein LOC131323638 n=1 Tax=Rhododendron vialii TaxID=182163 RepID=UPI0026601D98|nr:uncharacterized protein LOC131323638 [Rhododendron vialii]
MNSNSRQGKDLHVNHFLANQEIKRYYHYKNKLLLNPSTPSSPMSKPMHQKRKTHNPNKSSSQKCRHNEAKTLENKEETNKQQAGDQTGIDRLSDLPEPIIHKILLCLTLSDAINTRPLSRWWRYGIWPSCPILFFHEYSFGANYFQYDTEQNGNRRRFAKFLLNSLQKQKEGASNYGSIEKFGVRMALLGHKWDAAVDGWVKFAIANDVKELDLRIKRVLEHCFERYRLDDCVFVCRSLTALYLDYCGIRLDCVTVDLPSLKRLTLSEVEITNNSFCRLIGGCPSVEYLCVEFCKGLQVIKGLAPNLKSLKLNLTDVYLVSLGPLRLESVELSGDFTYSDPLMFDKLGTLKEMKLKNLNITDEQLQRLLDQSPMLETLIIEGCTGLERIRVRQKIKRFSMSRCRGIVEAGVLSANLESLEYSGDVTISFCCRDNLRSAEVRISLDPMELSAAWFFRLKKLLRVFAKSKVLTLACPSDQLVIFPGALCERLLPPLHDLKHLKLEIRTLSTSCPAIVDGLIWLFPGLETLTIKSGSINKLIKVN